MTQKLPPDITACIEEAALRLGRALDFLEWPNGEKDTPCHEVNALINFQVALSKLKPDFHFYSEGTIAERGRVDLVASNGDVSLAIEAKSFGNINERSDSILQDLGRLHDYVPGYYRGNESPKINEWWETSKARWGLILITSFRGDAVKEAWCSDDTRAVTQAMQSYSRKADRPAADGSGFIALHNAPSLERFAYPISLSDRWSTTGKGWLLCGAVPLPAHRAAA